jgi:putative transposase
MKRTRHTSEQIVRKLREADRLLAENIPLAEVMRYLEISHQTYQRWRSQYGAMRFDDVARLKTLEQENARLKRLLADKELDNDMLRMVAKGKWWPRTRTGRGVGSCWRVRGVGTSSVSGGWPVSQHTRPRTCSQPPFKYQNQEHRIKQKVTCLSVDVLSPVYQFSCNECCNCGSGFTHQLIGDIHHYHPSNSTTLFAKSSNFLAMVGLPLVSFFIETS